MCRVCHRCETELDRRTDCLPLREMAAALAKRSFRADGPALAAALKNMYAPVADETPNGSTPVTLNNIAAPAPAAPAVLGPYRIETELGRGGMGIVYRAYDETLHRTVAVKLLRPERANADAQKRLLREARIAARFRHDHAVVVHAVATPDDGPPYLVMEYLAGPTLAALIRERGRLEPVEAANIAVQVADGLAAAHAAGLVHGDIKPSNIIHDPDANRAKILDFGLSRLNEGGASLTQEGMLAGTPTYMSPEQVRSSNRTDGRADIYGLGVTLYEALTGAAPFRGTPARVLDQVLHDEPQPPRRLNERIPQDLETICLKAMAKEPGSRYQTAVALADDLRRFLSGHPIQARPASRAERLWRWRRRNPKVAFLSAALVFAVVAGTAGIAWQYARAVADRNEALRQKAQARVDFRTACETVDAYLTDVSEDPDLKARPLEPLRRKLLQKARDYYDRFVAQHPDEPDLLLELARADGRLADIIGELESQPKAVPYYLREQDLYHRLLHERPGNAELRRGLGRCCRRWARHSILRVTTSLPLTPSSSRDRCRRSSCANAPMMGKISTN